MTDDLVRLTAEEGRQPASVAVPDPKDTAPMFRSMVGRKITIVALNQERTQISFMFDDGHHRTFNVEGDCCSNSWIEHLEMPTTTSGGTVIGVHNGEPITQDHDDHDHDPERIGSSTNESIRVYNTVIQTDLGDIVIEYRNASNGYYGGSLSSPHVEWEEFE